MAIVIKVKAGERRAVFLIKDDQGEITCNTYKSYQERAKNDQYFAVDEYYEMMFPTDECIPTCVNELGRIAPGMKTQSEKQTKNFETAVYLCL